MKIITKKCKDNTDSDPRLYLSGDEVFYSVQGEGRNIGMPSVFLRLCYCNLNCRWCDTKYALKAKNNNGQDKFHSLNEVANMLLAYPVKKLVITGGEPLIQQNTLVSLLNMIPDWEVEIETNGTIIPQEDIAKRCQFNVSPKLASSGVSKTRRLKPQVLALFNKFEKTSFKFVVTKNCEDDVREIETIAREYGLDRKKIIIMPEGVKRSDMLRDTEMLVTIAKRHGWRVIPRLHILLWGNKRKV